METNRGNRICPYHKTKDKAGHIHDAATTKQSRYRVTGTPYDRIVNVKKDFTRTRRKGIFDCGCAEDDVLLDFYWWKTLTATSASSKITEGWRTQHLDPRARLFMKEAWEDASRLTVDDIYTHGKGRWEYEAYRCQLQIQEFQECLKQAQSKIAEKKSAATTSKV
jgi:hypothetical protein